MKISLLSLLFIFWVSVAPAQKILPGAERTQVYFPLLKGKRVAVFANQTSMVGNRSLIDTLISGGTNVVKVFGPEHGFSGQAGAGEHVESGTYKQTGIPVISLYGKHNKPSKEELADVDIMVYDIQDVGVRFYTFISSLEYWEEASLEFGIPFLILDRPNPNGFYVDGPVLDKKFKSFTGMQPVPIVYGMTAGEYGMMIAGEQWLSDMANKRYSYYQHAQNSHDTPFHFLVIKCSNYDHNSRYELPVKPSPNLGEMQAIYWYPTTCLFEGTVLSEGRGTEKPFEIFGHPLLPQHLFSFTPMSTEGAKDPKWKGEKCYGWNLSGSLREVSNRTDHKLQLQWLLKAYELFPDKNHFFISDQAFNRLAGNDILIKQIKEGKSENDIRNSWEPSLTVFKSIRKKYLLYKDFDK